MTTIDYEKEISNLKKLKTIIKNLPFNKMKMVLIYNYESLAYYLSELGLIDEDYITQNIAIEYEYYQNKMYRLENKKFYKSFYDNLDLIYEIIYKNVDIYNKYPILLLSSSDYSEQKISGRELGKLMDEFFQSLGVDVYNLYQKIGNNFLSFSNITDSKYAGCTYETTFNDYPHIIVEQKKNLFQMGETLAHEMGHCYNMIRNKTNKDFYQYDMLSEVISILFHKMFNLFLYEKGYYQKDALNNLLGWKCSIASMNLGCSLIPDTSYFGRESELYYDSEFIILKEVASKLNDNLLRALEFHPVMFCNYNYVLGDALANNLLALYKDNKKEGLKEIKNFITTIHQYSTGENLIRYGLATKETEREMYELYEYQKKKLYL